MEAPVHIMRMIAFDLGNEIADRLEVLAIVAPDTDPLIGEE
jgi:hypothetical protein